MQRSTWLALIAAVACASAAPTIAPPPQSAGIAGDIHYLASKALEGRAAGTRGNDSAAAFLARRHQALGLPGAFPGVCATGESCGVSYYQYFKSEGARGHNVGAYIRGSDPNLFREFVVIGAHYDHLGQSPRMALDPELLASVRPGADDNASGTAAVLELARRLAVRPPARSVLLLHFDAEEEGLIGSRAFAQHSPVPVSAIVFMLNLDMVGRLRGRDLLIDGSGADGPTKALADSVARAVGVPSARSTLSAGRSDHATFFTLGVPALSLTSGFHADYHRVTDVASRIDLIGLERIIDVAEGIVRAVAAPTWPPHQSSSLAPK